jgi:poly(3-hydroxybutyrate) depolymerase
MTLASLLLALCLQDPLTDFLKADGKDEKAALDAAVKSFKGNLKQALDAVRAVKPLSSLEPGVHHDLKFKSGKQEWDYSIRLPKDYDGTKRFPVLVLPDHSTIDPKSGIGFWEMDKDHIEKVILFRPVIVRHMQDVARFPDQKPLAIHPAIAAVMRDALLHLRLHYAVDADRISMTGLSQVGFYTWFIAVSFPDHFAAIVPESAGGPIVPTFIEPFATNLKSVPVRILHTKGDQRTPYEHAELMEKAVRTAGGRVELMTFSAADYPTPNELLHPVPSGKRLEHVLPWTLEQKRELPTSFTRELRYPVQGLEGRFRIVSSFDWMKPRTVTCREEKGELSVQGADAVYLVSPEEVLEGKQFVVGKKKLKPKPDLELLFRSFKSAGDLRRLSAAEIPLKP